MLRTAGRVAAAQDIEAYLVGGAVRDMLLERPTTDLDFVTVGSGSGIRLAEAVSEELGGQTVHVYPKFGTAAIRVHDSQVDEPFVLEFVGARTESYRRSSRKPIVEEGTLMDDLRRRDFTVNAMAMTLDPNAFGKLIDPFDGLHDLSDRLIRTPLDPEATFDDDPLRMVRAARFAAQLRFRIDDAARTAMQSRSERVDILSQERITDELQKMICVAEPSVGFRILFETGLLHHILPELVELQGVEAVDGHRHKDNFFHTLQVLDNLAAMTSERDEEETRYLRWAALLHDIGKPVTKRFSRSAGWTFHGHEDLGARMIPGLFKRLKLPSDDRMKYVRKLILLHHRPVALVDEEVTDSAVRRLLFEAGDDIDDLMTLVRADITSKNPRRVQRYLNAFDRVEQKLYRVEEEDRLRNFQPPVDGYEIMETLGITEGVSIGIIKEAIREAILDGRIPNEHDAAFDLMMSMKEDALRRGDLFEEVIQDLRGRERAATGAIKEEIFRGDLPRDHDAAYRHLMRIKENVLEERQES
ncbi:MAG: HD domain-containing protein [Rhodothermales bacterium]